MKTIISTIAIGLIILFSASCRRDTETTQDFEAIDSPVPIYDKDFHTTLPSGLSIDAYALEGPPSTEPLVFDPVSDYQQEQILAIHEEDRKLQYAENTFFNEIGFGMTAEINDRILVAREIYTTSHKTKPDSPASAAIEVVLGDDVVFTADAGVASPLTHLQGLWSYKEDWVLEYAHATITFNETENTT